MATTPNYGWVTPAPTDYVTDLPADFETFADAVDDTVKDLNPGTTAGDLDYYTSSTAKARLPIGTSGQLLAVNSTTDAVEWVDAPVSGGITWTQRARTYELGFDDVVHAGYANSKWFISGRNYAGTAGKIAYSSDGISWTTVEPGGSGRINYLHWSALTNLWIAAGASGQLYTSPDLVTWTSRTSGFSTTDINSIAENGSIIVAVGDAGKISSSTNGTTWTSRTSNVSTNNIFGVVWGEAAGRFVAVANNTTASTGATSSTNGTSWTGATTSNEMLNVVYANGQYFGWTTSNSNGMYSSNGTSWSALFSGTLVPQIQDSQIKPFTNYGSGLLFHIEDGASSITISPKLVVSDATVSEGRITGLFLANAPFLNQNDNPTYASIAVNGSQILVVTNTGAIATSF